MRRNILDRMEKRRIIKVSNKVRKKGKKARHDHQQ